MYKTKIYIILATILFIIDRIIKDFFISFLKLNNFVFFKNFYYGIGFNKSINKRAIFNIYVPKNILLLLIIILLTFLIYQLFNFYKNKNSLIALILIIFGGFSNLLDRIIYKGVIDYIQIFIWPIFNLADVMIVSGVILFLFNYYLKQKRART